MFAGNSHCLPYRVSDNTQALVTCAATSQPTIASLEIRIWCEARGCIRNKFSVHLSSTGCFLSVPLIFTSSRQSCCSASINAIIDAVRRICQENIFLKTATFFLFHASNLCKGSVVRMLPRNHAKSMKNCILRGKKRHGIYNDMPSMSSEETTEYTEYVSRRKGKL